MYLHVRKSPIANALVVTFRESVREGDRVLKVQHHVASCPLGLKRGRRVNPRAVRYREHVVWFWNNFDAECERFSVSPSVKRDYERRVRAAGVPRRPRRGREGGTGAGA